MRFWSEFKWHQGKLEENIKLFKDYDCQIGISVTRHKMKAAENFIDRMNQKDISVYLWPLNGHYPEFLANKYWINTTTVDSTVKLLEDMIHLIKYPNVEVVTLDIESWPFVEHFMNMEKAREKLERSVEIIQKDLKKEVMTMQWYWPGFSWAFNLPIPKNAKRRLFMVYPSMSMTRFASLKSREFFIKSAIRQGIDEYGEIHIDLGASDTGIYKHLLYPFCKIFEYGGPQKLREDIQIARENGAKSVGVYNLDSMMKNLSKWLPELVK